MGILVCSREWISTHTLLEILKSIILIYEYKCCLSSKILYQHGLQLVTVAPLQFLQFLMDIPCESGLSAAVKDCGVGVYLIARLKTVE